MAGGNLDGYDHFAPHMGRPIKLRSYSYLGRNFYGRRDQHFPDLDGASLAGRSIDSSHHCRRTNAGVSIAHRHNGRTNRNPFSCLWVAGYPVVLSRLACLDFGDSGSLPGSFHTRSLLALLRLWRSRREPVAINRTRRLGNLRRCLPGDLMPTQHP